MNDWFRRLPYRDRVLLLICLALAGALVIVWSDTFAHFIAQWVYALTDRAVALLAWLFTITLLWYGSGGARRLGRTRNRPTRRERRRARRAARKAAAQAPPPRAEQAS